MMALIHLNKFLEGEGNDKNCGVVRLYPQNSIFPAFHYSDRMILSEKNNTFKRWNADRRMLR